MKYIIISIIFIITLLSNAIYIFYGPATGKQADKSEKVFTYKTPDNEIWINKNRTALERMRNHYISGSDSIIDSLEAENQQVILLRQLEPDVQEMLSPSKSYSPYFLIFNSLIIITGFSFICYLALKRKQTETSFSSITKVNVPEVQPGESAQYNKSLNNDQVLNKSKEIICEILQIINKHSDNNISPRQDSLDNFANEQVSKIKTSSTLQDLLTVEEDINKIIPEHFENTKSLVNTKFNELRTMLNELAEDFGSITEDSTNFSGQIKDSMSHIEKAIELNEIKEIRKKITLETSSMRKVIAKKQEKDAIIIDSLTYKVKSMKAELASAKEEVLIDGLTQIYNRKAFDKKISDFFKQRSKKNLPFTLVMVDIDYFKKVNDEYGHTVGDEILKKVASTIKETFRLNDFVARYGGEEFSVMIDRIDSHYIMDVCERLRMAIEAINFTVDSDTIPTSASIGIAFSKQSDTPKMLIDRADKALYLAKESGRNTIKSEVDLSETELETVST
ncbi:MAG: GGDEF domain-containing protein [Candidatus Scalindua rubra]|nr:GGDEF domain-containing protein [Candidatus Scalindua rubra]TWU31693.1 Response regulator PleD [Candidatus Brocadiaceae bacterium S225]